MLFEEYNLKTAIEVAKEEGLAQGEERGKVKGALETLLELNLPTSVIREKLYQKYPDERDLVDLLLLHEEPECYDAKK